MVVALLSRILLTLAILIVASKAQSSADIAKGAAAEREQYVENARAGVRHITNFVANTSACTSLAACEQARQEQSKALQSLTSAAKAATQSSKKAGQVACKFARKAGTREREAEGARDTAERVAEHLELEAEHQADKAHQRMEGAFEQARRQMKEKATKEDTEIADTKTAPEALNLAVVPLSLVVDSSVDVAEKAASDRDAYIEEARAGIKHITNFVANTSACTSLASCEEARQAESKTLQSLSSAAKAATQSSKKAGQVACKFARKAGTIEREAEGARDAAERVAEHLEGEAEHQAGKAQARMESAFEQARRQMKASAAKKVLANDALESLAASRVIHAGVVVGLVLTLSAGILGIFAGLRRANVDRSLEQPILSTEGSTCV